MFNDVEDEILNSQEIKSYTINRIFLPTNEELCNRVLDLLGDTAFIETRVVNNKRLRQYGISEQRPLYVDVSEDFVTQDRGVIARILHKDNCCEMKKLLITEAEQF